MTPELLPPLLLKGDGKERGWERMRSVNFEDIVQKSVIVTYQYESISDLKLQISEFRVLLNFSLQTPVT